jgi:subtilisin
MIDHRRIEVRGSIMKRVRAAAALIALSLIAVVSSAVSPVVDARVNEADVVPGGYIVVLGDHDPGAVAAEHGRAPDVAVSHVYRHALRGYSATMSARAAERIARDPRVAYVDRDHVVTTTHHQCGHDKPTPGACGTVSGNVSHLGVPIVGASVGVDGRSATTNTSGDYTIFDVNTGTQVVTASAPSYATQSTTVAVTGGSTTYVDFALVPSEETPPPDEPPPADDPAPPVGYDVPTGVQRIFWESSSAVGSDGQLASTTYPGVAIIDTGISTSHPDLNVVGGRNCSTGNSYDDGNGHGTHVAGTVAANGKIVGVAPGAPLYAVRVLNNAGSGSWSSVICGVDWVTANAASIEVANMSLGGSGTAGSSCTSSSLRQAICNSVTAGVTYVVSAGNSGADAKDFVPAAYPETITVAAIADFNGLPGGGAPSTCRTDTDDTHANFSNYGTATAGQPGHVDITAPGVCILSTWHSGSGYNTISGTSMSGPHVAGAAALYLSGVSTATQRTPSAVRGAMVSSANSGYAYTWKSDNGPVPGIKPPLLDVSGF